MPADGLTPTGTRASAGAVVTKFGSRIFSVPELRWLAYCGMNKNTEIMQATFSKSFSLIKVSVFVPMDKRCNVDNLITKLFKLIIYPYHQKHNKSLAYHMRCTVIYPVHIRWVSRAGTSNYIPQCMWVVISCACPWYAAYFVFSVHLFNDCLSSKLVGCIPQIKFFIFQMLSFTSNDIHYRIQSINKVAAILQKIFWSSFPCMESVVFWFKLHWSLFLRI